MLKQHSHVMLTLLMLADACAITAAWLASFWLRFTYLPVHPDKGVPDLADRFLPMLPLVVAIHLIVFIRVRLYRPRRHNTLASEIKDIAKAFFVAVVAVVLLDYAMPQTNKISRGFLLTYAVVGASFFALFRLAVRIALRSLRRRGFNRRTAAIIGVGRTAQKLLHALHRNAWTGIEVGYFIDNRASQEAPGKIRSVPVYGPLHEARRIVEEHPVDAIFIALPPHQSDRLDELLEALETTMADVRIVPQVSPTHTLRPNVSELDGLPILALRQTPLYGWNVVLKRAFDLIVGSFCLLLAAAPMLLIALAVKLTSRGPVLYRQRRMGLDGREFDMFKFRTMREDAERDGPVWSQSEDDRRTSVGRLLRRTSLDELPNLLNVLRGEMSLVGPRPERPEFIAQFKDEIPRYMQRHKMKAGMTGFAQVRGYRGATSLKKRIQHDVHYINNWSLGLDLRILMRTLAGVWFSRHEH